MRASAALVAMAWVAAGCASRGVVSRQRQAPRARTLPGAALIVAEYTSGVPEVPPQSPLLLQAREDLIRSFQAAGLFETVYPDVTDTPPRGACLLKPKFRQTYIETDTGFWRNFLVCASVVGLFLNANVNEIAAADTFDVDVLVRAEAGYSSVEKLLFEMKTVYRYSALTALIGADWAAVQDEMFLVANRNMAADLVRELPDLLRKAGADGGAP